MTFTEVIVLALALALDATIVCFSFGLVVKEQRGKIAFVLAVSTGLGQFVMPVLGYFLASSVIDYIRDWDHWLVFGIFFALGAKFIWDAISPSDKEKEEITSVSMKSFILVGVLTSIDALFSGPIFVLTNTALWSSALLIGAVTFVLSLVGFGLTKVLHHLPGKVLEVFVGVVLIALGGRVLMEHL